MKRILGFAMLCITGVAVLGGLAAMGQQPKPLPKGPEVAEDRIVINKNGDTVSRVALEKLIAEHINDHEVVLVRADDKPKAVKHPRGHVPAPPEVRAALHQAAARRHGNRVADLPRVTAPSWDERTLGHVLPCDDQMQCGDCFGVSTTDGCSMALIRAGQLPMDASKGRLSSQYGLDFPKCFQGGCNGGDEAQVADYIKTTGMPTTSDYGPYTGGPGRPQNVTGMKFYQIADWGYCTPSQQSGIASTQDIKNCMVQYGPISVAFDAGECDSYTWPGTMTGRGTSVDHAVLCIGWDDAHDNGDGSKGAFLGFNQWGAGWGNNGVFWIKYGADSWGTESIWLTATALPPPPPPPTPPVPPIPPVPPVPPIPPTPPNPGLVSAAVLNFADGTTQTLVPPTPARTGVTITYTMDAAGNVTGMAVKDVTAKSGRPEFYCLDANGNPVPCATKPSYTWEPVPGAADQMACMADGVQCGSYNYTSRIFRPLRGGRWLSATAPPVTPPAAPAFYYSTIGGCSTGNCR